MPLLFSGVSGITSIVLCNRHNDQSSNILDETFCISHCTNILGKSMNPTISPPLKETGLLYFVFGNWFRKKKTLNPNLISSPLKLTLYRILLVRRDWMNINTFVNTTSIFARHHFPFLS